MKARKELPDKFYMCGIANGGFQAGLYASYAPEQIEKLLILSPSRFCPPPTDEFDPYILEMNLSQANDRFQKRHVLDDLTQKSTSVNVHEFKSRCLRKRHNLSDKEA